MSGSRQILVDTQIFLWAITDDRRLSRTHREIYLDEKSDLYLGLGSVWEILIKSGIGKLPIPTPAVDYVVSQMRKNRVNALPVRMHHLKELEALPPVHKDPFDRLLVAQARSENMPILSADPLLKQYGVPML
ncbi:MAG TPA: type II toxin-antitoxin system VapC family toxin [Bryobacteraceae bacterium]